MLFPPLDKRNIRDKAKGLRISSERHIGELDVRYLSPLNIEDRILGNSRMQRACREERKEKPHGLPIEGRPWGLCVVCDLAEWLSRGVR